MGTFRGYFLCSSTFVASAAERDSSRRVDDTHARTHARTDGRASAGVRSHAASDPCVRRIVRVNERTNERSQSTIERCPPQHPLFECYPPDDRVVVPVAPPVDDTDRSFARTPRCPLRRPRPRTLGRRNAPRSMTPSGETTTSFQCTEGFSTISSHPFWRIDCS